jgi:haloacetate dehalogenase
VIPGFEYQTVETSGAKIHVAVAGEGPPVLLIHGYPQTHTMWHAVAPALTATHTVVCPDLRGYGQSSKPPGDPEHVLYSKRALALDMVEVMSDLGFARFGLVGHDRGGRVAHRLALDHPHATTCVTFLDIVPTLDVFENVDKSVAMGTYHWFFLSQPYDLPERMIGADPGFFLRWHLRAWSGGTDAFFSPDALDEYERAFSDPATIHASCEDYRAGATIDLEHDAADRDSKIECPVLVLWGARSKAGDLREVWRSRAKNVRGESLDAGHFLAEELPADVSDRLAAFLVEDA